MKNGVSINFYILQHLHHCHLLFVVIGIAVWLLVCLSALFSDYYTAGFYSCQLSVYT